MKLFKVIYTRITYMLFRVYYTFTHLIAFIYMNGDADTGKIRENPYILLCGIEPHNMYSREKISLFIRHCNEFFTGKKIILLSKLDNWKEYSDMFPVTIIPWDYQTRARLLNRLNKIIYRKAAFDESVVENYARNAAFMIDLGSYQLDARKATGWTANMLSNIVFAKRFSIPFYAFPQSVSPFFSLFSFPFPLKFILNRMIKKIPSYAQEFCIREKWGMAEFDRYSHGNTRRCLEYLLYSNTEILSGVVVGTEINRLICVPDKELLQKKELFVRLLDALVEKYSSSFKEFILFVYDAGDDLLIGQMKNSILPVWKIQKVGAGTNDKTIVQAGGNNLLISSHYLALVHGLLTGTPAIALSSDRTITSLYEDFLLNQYVINFSDADFHEKAIRLLGLLILNRNAISENVSTIRKELVRKYPLPLFEC